MPLAVRREGLADGHPPPQRSSGRSGDAESPSALAGGGGDGQGHPLVLPGASGGSAQRRPSGAPPGFNSVPKPPRGRCHPPLAGPGVWAGGRAALSGAKQSFVTVPLPQGGLILSLRFRESQEGFISLPRGPESPNPACAGGRSGEGDSAAPSPFHPLSPWGAQQW